MLTYTINLNYFALSYICIIYVFFKYNNIQKKSFD